MSDEIATEALETASIDSGTAPEGQANVAAPVEGQAPAPFYSHTWDDGKEDVWNTSDDLKGWMRQSGMRHSDYTRKTQQVADSRKMLDQKIKDYDNKERTFNESYSNIMGMDKFLKENPQVQERIKREMQGNLGNPAVEKLLGEKLKPLEEKLSRYEQDEQRRAAEKAREDAYGAVSGRFPDFDRKTIESAIQAFEEVPEQMRLEHFVETLYHAGKGRMTPGEIERKRAMTASKPRPATPTATVGIPDTKVGSMSSEEEMALALQAMEAAKSG